MAAEVMQLPDEFREAARNRSYANRSQEAEAIDRADQAVFDRCRDHEVWLAKQADDLNASAQQDIDAGTALLGDVAELAMGVANGDVLVDQQSAKSYEAARANVSAAIAELHYLRQRIEFAADKAADPYRSLSDILAKYSVLRASGRSWIRD